MLKFKNQWLFLPVLSLGMTSCGKGNVSGFEAYESSNYSPYQEHLIPEEVGVWPEFWGKPVKFQCTVRSCHTGQALILSADGSPGTISSCSSTLISETIVVTNSHCMPRIDRNSCDGTEVFFPEIRNELGEVIHESVSRKCGKIIAKSLPRSAMDHLDFAVIELAEAVVGRAIGKVSLDGVTDNEVLEYSASMVSHYLDQYFVRPTIIKCRSVMNTLSLPMYDHSQSPIIAINGCNPIPGNSGSSLLNDRGEIVALVQAGFSTIPKNYFNDFVSNVDSFPVPSTSMRCVDPFNHLNDIAKSTCREEIAKLMKVDLGNLLVSSLEKKVTDSSDQFDSKYFRWGWTLIKDPESKKFDLAHTPKCFRRNLDWVDSERTFFGRFTLKELKFEHISAYPIQVNSFAKYEVLDLLPGWGVKVFFNSSKIKSEPKIDIRLEYLKYGKASKELVFRDTLELCEK